MQTLYDFVFQGSAAEDDKAQKRDDAYDQADDPRQTVGVQPAGIVNAEEQQNVRQNADADVHEQIHERVCCKAAAQEGKNKVADQRCTAQNRHDEVQTVPRVAVEPVGKDEQRRD